MARNTVGDEARRGALSTTGKVGVGTSTPSKTLTVVGPATAGTNASTMALVNQGSGAAGAGLEFAATYLPTGADLAMINARISGVTLNAATGAGAFIVETTTGGALTERVRVDSAGRVGIGTSAPSGHLTIRENAGNDQVHVEKRADSVSGVSIRIRKARGTDATPAIVQSGDEIGYLTFSGHDGSSYQLAGYVASNVDAVPGAGDMPGRLTFSTTPDGTASPLERMRITSAGDVGIGTSSPSAKLHVSGTATITGTITTGLSAGNVVANSSGVLSTVAIEDDQPILAAQVFG